VKLTTHLHPAQRLRTRGAIPPFPHTSSWRAQGQLYNYLLYTNRNVSLWFCQTKLNGFTFNEGGGVLRQKAEIFLILHVPLYNEGTSQRYHENLSVCNITIYWLYPDSGFELGNPTNISNPCNNFLLITPEKRVPYFCSGSEEENKVTQYRSTLRFKLEFLSQLFINFVKKGKNSLSGRKEQNKKHQ
jgi:hypothetical protein